MTFEEKFAKIQKILEKDGNNMDLLMDLGAIRESIGKIDELNQQNDEIIKSSGLTEKEFEQLSEIVKKLESLSDEEKNYGGKQNIDSFAEMLQPKPYTIPQLYSSSTVDESFSVKDGYELHPENISKMFWTMYPGNKNRDYEKTLKVKCGAFENFRVNLRRQGHLFSDDPVFSVEGNDVYQVKILNTSIPPTRGFYPTKRGVRYDITCRSCLTYPDYDETMECSCPDPIPDQNGVDRWKFHTYMYQNQVQTSPNKQTTILSDLEEEKSQSKHLEFKKPFNEFFDVYMMENITVGKYLTGFTRYAKKLGVFTEIEYEPYIGHILKTKGLMFELKDFPSDYIDEIFSKSFLVRDIIICLIENQLSDALKNNNRNKYEIELFTKSCLSELGLDSFDNTFDYQQTCDTINQAGWIQGCITRVNQELPNWPRSHQNIDANLIQTILENVTNIVFNKEIIKNKIKKNLVSSLAHILYITSYLTAGIDFSDIDYHIDFGVNNEKSKILIFDNSSGGNGSSELIYKNLLSPEEQYVFTKAAHIAKPRYFDEGLAEIFLPCNQGVTERIYHQNLSNLIRNNRMLENKLKYLEHFAMKNPQISNEIKQRTIFNLFPSQIGLIHEIGEEGNLQHISSDESNRLRLASEICIHGCPDCISIGRDFKGEILSERFSVSKYLLDLLFKFHTKNMRISNSFNKNEIEKKLADEGAVILSKEITAAAPDFRDLELTVSRLLGKEIGDKLCKISGCWADCEISDSPSISYSYMISLMKPFDTEPE